MTTDDTLRWRSAVGPWNNEPDAVDWTTAAGFAGAVRRVPWSGHLCGYVGVPAGHPWHGKDYLDIDASAHGGITFAKLGSDCHDLSPSELWWLGFDCAHSGDETPLDAAQHSFRDGWYKSLDFVKHEVEELAKQVADRESPVAVRADIEEMEAQATELAERFWPKVNNEGGPEACWLWREHLSTTGYGVFHERLGRGVNGNRNTQSHRASWELTHGPIPDGLCVLHRCDTPRCVNPGHLFLGTRQDNNADKIAKGRQARGEGNGQARLTEAKVRQIRQDYASGINQYELARAFEVSQVTISNILRGKVWSHVT